MNNCFTMSCASGWLSVDRSHLLVNCKLKKWEIKTPDYRWFLICFNFAIEFKENWDVQLPLNCATQLDYENYKVPRNQKLLEFLMSKASLSDIIEPLREYFKNFPWFLFPIPFQFLIVHGLFCFFVRRFNRKIRTRNAKRTKNRDKTRQSFMLHKQVQGEVKKLFTELKRQKGKLRERIATTFRCFEAKF